MARMTYDEAAEIWEGALDRAGRLQELWPGTRFSEHIFYQKRGETHPNDYAYKAARKILVDIILAPTGWSERELEDECESRLDARLNLSNTAQS